MQAQLLLFPDYTQYVYKGLFFPLAYARIVDYFELKYQYFLIDFCYYCNAIFMIWLCFGVFGDAAVFALVNGPLGAAAVIWKNALALNEPQHVVSVFIHLYPAIVTYTLPPVQSLDVMALLQACCLYTVWQAGYLLKTQWLDYEYLQQSGLSTSERWLTQKAPHPLWRWVQHKQSEQGSYWTMLSPTVTLVLVQAVFTLSTLVLSALFQLSKALHLAWLLALLVATVHNGARVTFRVKHP